MIIHDIIRLFGIPKEIKRLSLLDVKRRSEILFWCKKLWLVSLNFVSTCTKWDLTASTLLFQNVISKIEFV